MAAERRTQVTGRQLEWLARRAAGGALKPDDVILDVEVGKLKRFRDNGVDTPIVTRGKLARVVPLARGLMNIAYTREQVLFLADGLAVNCHIGWVHRAELDRDKNQVFVFARQESPLAILAFEEISARDSKQPSAFVDHLLGVRDEERAKLPPATREHLEALDESLRSRSIDELWELPAHHLKLSNAVSSNQMDREALDAFEPEETLSDVRWQILSDAIIAAHSGEAEAMRTAMMRLETDVPAEGHATMYVWYLLRYVIADHLGRRPELKDLQEIARYRHREFSQVVQGGARALEDELCTAFGMAGPGQEVTGGMFAVLGIAALGVLLKDPAAQLASIKPRMADWWQRRGRDMVREGVRSRVGSDEAHQRPDSR
jgi:hypothetical protein